jgi:hypothetical protein
MSAPAAGNPMSYLKRKRRKALVSLVVALALCGILASQNTAIFNVLITILAGLALLIGFFFLIYGCLYVMKLLAEGNTLIARAGRGLVGIVFGLGLLSQAPYTLNLLKEGVIVEGSVTSREYSWGGCDSCSEYYYVSYSWEVNGHPFSSRVDNRHVYNSYKDGDSISLLYLPNDPSKAEPREALMDIQWVYSGLEGVAIIVAALGYIIFVVWKAGLTYKYKHLAT